MKNKFKYIIGACCMSSLFLTGCIDEVYPTSGATSEQLASSSKATEALLWAMPAYTNKLYDEDAGYGWGYGSMMHIRDVMTTDVAVISSNYDHYNSWESNTYIGPSYRSTQVIWNYFWQYVLTTNNLISAIDENSATDVQIGYLAIAKAFRASIYLDMAQMYEFLPNDKTQPLSPQGNNILNLTVPIVTEKTTEEESYDNPRATRETMSAFILSDLEYAQSHIKSAQINNKTVPSLGVVYGLKARLYMWIGDYENAQKNARLAIESGNYSPMTKDECLNIKKGFNSLSPKSWMWGAQTTGDDDVVKTGILNWTSWLSNETDYGYAAAGPLTMIDASLYAKIDDNDFRKLLWKAPKGSDLEGQNEYINQTWGESLPTYASLKFRPNEGNMADYKIGSASAYPLMRVEEMYLIEAEAAAHKNPADGKTLLTKFMTSYRNPSYTTSASSAEEVVQEVVLQKRIELWGEGQSYYDFKRLDMPVIRGYEGTNFSEARRFNTTTRPAWMNFCIVQTEGNSNAAVKDYNNPDPAGLYTPWVPSN